MCMGNGATFRFIGAWSVGNNLWWYFNGSFWWHIASTSHESGIANASIYIRASLWYKLFSISIYAIKFYIWYVRYFDCFIFCELRFVKLHIKEWNCEIDQCFYLCISLSPQRHKVMDILYYLIFRMANLLQRVKCIVWQWFYLMQQQQMAQHCQWHLRGNKS